MKGDFDTLDEVFKAVSKLNDGFTEYKYNRYDQVEVLDTETGDELEVNQKTVEIIK